MPELRLATDRRVQGGRLQHDTSVSYLLVQIVNISEEASYLETVASAAWDRSYKQLSARNSVLVNFFQNHYILFKHSTCN